ncbi:hypothetical protein [Paraburkholderia sacchari]|uniref:hypothetical protein n=1 Tax=Paraburkholderia sacchari TaxID=159450 RepID=UPI001BCD5367|nr:hypothetical protein [Paraburkholderia sacchari]
MAARPALRVRILARDFAMLHAFEREWLPAYKLDWRSGGRLKFRLDGQHPPSPAEPRHLEHSRRGGHGFQIRARSIFRLAAANRTARSTSISCIAASRCESSRRISV